METEQKKIPVSGKGLTSILKKREVNILIPLIIIALITTSVNPVFLSLTNIVELLKNVSFDLIVAVGMTFMLISGNLDLSIGAVISLSGMATGFCLVNHMPIFFSVLIGLLVSFLVGMINGLLVVKVNIPSVITTLGTMYMCNGLILIVSKGRNYSPLPESFTAFGRGELFGISYSVYIALAAVIVFSYILNHTTYGRSVMALGGNAEATRLAGINTGRLRISIYCILALMAGIAGILITSRINAAVANSGNGKELSIPAAVIIGGTSIFGGVGSVIGTVIGVTIMEVLSNALVMLHVSAYYQNLFIGAIMLLAVSIDSLRSNGNMRRKRG